MAQLVVATSVATLRSLPPAASLLLRQLHQPLYACVGLHLLRLRRDLVRLRLAPAWPAVSSRLPAFSPFSFAIWAIRASIYACFAAPVGSRAPAVANGVRASFSSFLSCNFCCALRDHLLLRAFRAPEGWASSAAHRERAPSRSPRSSWRRRLARARYVRNGGEGNAECRASQATGDDVPADYRHRFPPT